jgi:hypothetical protein
MSFTAVATTASRHCFKDIEGLFSPKETLKLLSSETISGQQQTPMITGSMVSSSDSR